MLEPPTFDKTYSFLLKAGWFGVASFEISGAFFHEDNAVAFMQEGTASLLLLLVSSRNNTLS